MDDRNIQDRQVQTKVFSAAAKELQHANSAQLNMRGGQRREPVQASTMSSTTAR